MAIKKQVVYEDEKIYVIPIRLNGKTIKKIDRKREGTRLKRASYISLQIENIK